VILFDEFCGIILVRLQYAVYNIGLAIL